MTISITSPTSTTSKIQQNGNDVLTVDSSNNVTVTNNLSVSGTVTASGNINFDSNTLYVDTTNNRVGIGTSSPATPLHTVQSGQSSIALFQNTNASWAGDVQVTYAPGGSTASTLGLSARSDGSTWTTSNYGDMLFITGTSGSGFERMRITSNGYVTMTNQPIAQINSNITYDPASTTEIVWTNVNINTGSHYSTSTGRFTAPIAGKYMVTTSFHGPNDRTSRGYIAKNGTQIKGWAGSADADWHNTGTQVIADLAAGDYISIYIWAGNYVHGDPAWGGWSIYLIG